MGLLIIGRLCYVELVTSANLCYQPYFYSPGLKSVPLLLVHGWPGSVYEFYDSVPLLQSKAEKSGFSFDIIIPSIPGYGWSEPSYRVGKFGIVSQNLLARISNTRVFFAWYPIH